MNQDARAPNQSVILSEAKNLTNSVYVRSLAALGMTRRKRARITIRMSYSRVDFGKRVCCSCWITTRFQFRWAFAVHDRARDGNVFQFRFVRGATQQQSAAAHVSPPDKVGRKAQTFLKICEQNVDVFSGGNTAEQNNGSIARKFFCQFSRIPLEWLAITRIVLVNIDLGELAQVIKRDARLRVDQSTCRRDDERAANSARGASKCIRVGNFATKIKAA